MSGQQADLVWRRNRQTRHHDAMMKRVQEMEDRQEQQEIPERRDNILLYGVPEADGESEVHENCEGKFVLTVNSAFLSHPCN